MTTLDMVVLLVTCLLSSTVQGMSGLGFGLVASPVAAQVVPGSTGVGLVNLLALLENTWQVWREHGRIHWHAVRQMLPGLLIGTLLAVAGVRRLDEAYRPLLVAVTALASLAALVYWRPSCSVGNATVAGVWGASSKVYAGVGGPPMACYLLHQGWHHADFVRTLQVVFIALNAVSIPVLGVPSESLVLVPHSLGVLVVGASLGMRMRGRVAPLTARRIAQTTIAVTCAVALLRSIAILVQP